MTGEPSFFSIGVGDADRARVFYGALFGWEFAEPPSRRGAVIETTEVPGGIHGGDPGASPYLFFRVEDIEAAAAHVRELGAGSRRSTSMTTTTRRRSRASAASSSAATTRAHRWAAPAAECVLSPGLRPHA